MRETSKRILTAIGLLLLLFVMFFFKIAYLFILLLIVVVSFLEFSKMILKIFEKNKISQFFCNILFLVYLSFFFIIALLGINDIHLRIILFMVTLICVASDIGGFVIGKIVKGPKLIKISPKKTISGSLGSFIFSVAVSYFLFTYTFEISLFFKIAIGILISLIVQIGDLIFSYIKRKSGFKDTGKIFPGHGGLLDRIDGILLGIPFGLIIMIVALTK